MAITLATGQGDRQPFSQAFHSPLLMFRSFTTCAVASHAKQSPFTLSLHAKPRGNSYDSPRTIGNPMIHFQPLPCLPPSMATPYAKYYYLFPSVSLVVFAVATTCQRVVALSPALGWAKAKWVNKLTLATTVRAVHSGTGTSPHLSLSSPPLQSHVGWVRVRSSVPESPALSAC